MESFTYLRTVISIREYNYVSSTSIITIVIANCFFLVILFSLVFYYVNDSRRVCKQTRLEYWRSEPATMCFS